MLKTDNHIEALSKIAQVITSDMYLDDILKLIVTVTAQTLGSKICSIMLVDEKNQELVIRATQSISEDYNQKPPLKIGEGLPVKRQRRRGQSAFMMLPRKRSISIKILPARTVWSLCSAFL